MNNLLIGTSWFEMIADWVKKIRLWNKKYDVYCYFNNDMDGHAVENSRSLAKFLNDPYTNPE